MFNLPPFQISRLLGPQSGLAKIALNPQPLPPGPPDPERVIATLVGLP